MKFRVHLCIQQSENTAPCWLNGLIDLLLSDVIIRLLRSQAHNKFYLTEVWHFKSILSTSVPKFIQSISWLKSSATLAF